MERSSHRVLTALLVAVVSIPVTTQAVFRSQDTEELTLALSADLRPEVRMHRAADWRLMRRAYARAVEEYRQRVHAGDETAVMPDINDLETYRSFMVEAPEVPPEPEPMRRTPREGVERYFSSVDELGDRQRLILRRHTRAKRCPPEMERVFPGFYELCTSIVGDEAVEELPRGLDSASPRVRRPTVARPTLNLRLEMLRQARDRSTRRPDTFRRPRPTPFLGEDGTYDEGLDIEEW